MAFQLLKNNLLVDFDLFKIHLVAFVRRRVEQINTRKFIFDNGNFLRFDLILPLELSCTGFFFSFANKNRHFKVILTFNIYLFRFVFLCLFKDRSRRPLRYFIPLFSLLLQTLPLLLFRRCYNFINTFMRGGIFCFIVANFFVLSFCGFFCFLAVFNFFSLLLLSSRLFSFLSERRKPLFRTIK